MAFVTPSGYSPTGMGHSPRSGTQSTFGMTSTPTSTTSTGGEEDMDNNAIAGPSYSSGGVGLTPRNYAEADSRRESGEDM